MPRTTRCWSTAGSRGWLCSPAQSGMRDHIVTTRAPLPSSSDPPAGDRERGRQDVPDRPRVGRAESYPAALASSRAAARASSVHPWQLQICNPVIAAVNGTSPSVVSLRGRRRLVIAPPCHFSDPHSPLASLGVQASAHRQMRWPYAMALTGSYERISASARTSSDDLQIVDRPRTS